MAMRNTVIHFLGRCVAISVLAVMVLSGCQPKEPVAALLQDYQVRLARTLNVDPGNVTPGPRPSTALTPYPTRRELTQPLTPIKVDLLEFLRLSRCDLQRLVGQRNASLGRVMSHSQRWLYEASFITAADQCLRLLLTDPSKVKLQTLLQDALATKRAERWRVTWNASFASQEFQQLFSQAGQPLGLQSPRPGELISALQQLRRQIQRWHSTDVAPEQDIEGLYQVLGAGPWLGQLAQTLAVVNTQLQQLNGIQQTRLQGRALCFNERTNPDAEAMNTVFFKYYIGQVQPYLARIHQQANAVIEELDKLLALTGADTSEQHQVLLKHWQAFYSPHSDDSQWRIFQQLMAQHTRNWQQQLKQCGLIPTG